MRNLLRQPLTWMVIAECAVLAMLMAFVWSGVAAAATQHPGAAPAQAVLAPADASNTPLPDLTGATGPATPAQLPGLNLDAGFWRARLGQLNQDQVFFEQLEWNLVHSATDTMQRYLETVVLPSLSKAEHA